MSVTDVWEYLRSFNFVSALVRLLVAMLAGAAIGYGRARRQRNVGLRTYILTAIGACLTVLISLYDYGMLQSGWSEGVALTGLHFDGTRYAAGVISGVGFLASGTILAKANQQVSGLTSAVGLFAAACLGIVCGAGFYECVLIVVLLLVVALDVMQPLELAYKRRLRNVSVFVEFEDIGDVETIRRTIHEQGGTVFDIDVERTSREGENYPYAILTLKLSREMSSHSAILSSMAELACVRSVQELIS